MEEKTIHIKVTVKGDEDAFKVTEVKVDGELEDRIDIAQSRGGGFFWQIHEAQYAGLTLEYGTW